MIADLTAVLERVWTRIRHHHPDLPEVVLMIGSGVERGHLVKHGHYAPERWVVRDGVRPEVLLAAETIDRPPEAILGTVLHEAAHALAASRGVQDTSRQGRYHNGRFRVLAEGLGLSVVRLPGHGWAQTTPTAATVTRYAEEIEWILACDRGRRQEPVVREELEGDEKAGGMLALSCPCGRKVRMSRRAYAAGPLACGVCHAPFSPEDAPAEWRALVVPCSASEFAVLDRPIEPPYRSFLDRFLQTMRASDVDLEQVTVREAVELARAVTEDDAIWSRSAAAARLGMGDEERAAIRDRERRLLYAQRYEALTGRPWMPLAPHLFRPPFWLDHD